MREAIREIGQPTLRKQSHAIGGWSGHRVRGRPNVVYACMRVCVCVRACVAS